MSATPQPEPGYGLVMPFIVCASTGGPFDDAAFVAGCEFSFIESALRTIRPLGVGTYSRYVVPALVPQLELLAMRFGWKISAEPWEDHEDEWALVTFDIDLDPADAAAGLVPPESHETP